MDAIISHQIDLMRLDASMRAQVLAALDSLGYTLEQKLAKHDLTDFQKARFRSLLADVTDTIDSYYSTITDTINSNLVGVARLQSESFVFASVLDGSLPTTNVAKKIVDDTVIFGASAEDWWAKQAEDTKFRFAAEVRQGILAGEDRGAIATRVRDLIGVSGANAEALVRTSVQAVSANARTETYQQNSDVVIGTRQISTLDGRTTDICIAYSDAMYDLDGNPINGTDLPYNNGVPRHWNCRSVEVPLLDTTKALGFDISGGTTRAAEGGAVSADTSFDSWLSRQSIDQQNEQLGVGRAQLWRDGKITLRDLLNQNGNPLTLEELQNKVRRGG